MKWLIAVLVCVAMGAGCGGGESDPSDTAAPTTTVTESVGERNAREMAASYLEYSEFSRSGLIEQLEYEGFTTTQAEYGVDAVGY